MYLSEREFNNVSDARIYASQRRGIKPPPNWRCTMITLLVGLIASSIAAWWHRRQTTAEKA